MKLVIIVSVPSPGRTANRETIFMYIYKASAIRQIHLSLQGRWLIVTFLYNGSETLISIQTITEAYRALLGQRHFVVNIGFNCMQLRRLGYTHVSIHVCIYEYRADASLQNIADHITNQAISNTNSILGKRVIFDISPQT